MARQPVFYSFHFDNDVMRVQQIRNMGVVDGDEPVSPNEWEQIKRRGKASIEEWIDDNMKYKRCVVVLIGSETAGRHWVLHEIAKAWNEGRALLGIYIHNLKCPRNGTSAKGANLSEIFKLKDGTPLSRFISCHDPISSDAYGGIKEHLEGWVGDAIAQAQRR